MIPQKPSEMFYFLTAELIWERGEEIKLCVKFTTEPGIVLWVLRL